MTTPTKRISLDDLVLKSGGHRRPSDGMCVMEAVAYFRGIPHTDRPLCVSPAIASFLRTWNDNLNDDTVVELQASAFDLLDRMIAVGTTAIAA